MWSQTLIPAPPAPRNDTDNTENPNRRQSSQQQPPVPPPPTASTLFSPPRPATATATATARKVLHPPPPPVTHATPSQEEEEEDVSALFPNSDKNDDNDNDNTNDDDNDDEFEGGLESAVNLIGGMANALFQKTKDTVDTVKIVAQGPEALLVSNKSPPPLPSSSSSSLLTHQQTTQPQKLPPPIVTETSMLSSSLSSSTSMIPTTTTTTTTTTTNTNTFPPHTQPLVNLTQVPPSPSVVATFPPPPAPTITTAATTTTTTTSTTDPSIVASESESESPQESAAAVVEVPPPPPSATTTAPSPASPPDTTAAQLFAPPPPSVIVDEPVVVPSEVPAASALASFAPPTTTATITTGTTTTDTVAPQDNLRVPPPCPPVLVEEPIVPPVTSWTPPVTTTTTTAESAVVVVVATAQERMVPPSSPFQVVKEKPVVDVPANITTQAHAFPPTAPTPAVDSTANSTALPPPEQPPPLSFPPPATDMPSPSIQPPQQPPPSPLQSLNGTTTTPSPLSTTAGHFFSGPQQPHVPQHVPQQSHVPPSPLPSPQMGMMGATTTTTVSSFSSLSSSHPPKPSPSILKLPTPTSNSSSTTTKSTCTARKKQLQGPPPRMPSPSFSSNTTTTTTTERGVERKSHSSHTRRSHSHHHYPIPRPHLPLPPPSTTGATTTTTTTTIGGGGGSRSGIMSGGGSIGSATSNSTTTRQRRFGGFKVPPPTSIRTTTTTTTTIPTTTTNTSSSMTVDPAPPTTTTTSSSSSSQQLVNPTMIHTPSPSPTPYSNNNATPSLGKGDLGMGISSSSSSTTFEEVPFPSQPPCLPLEEQQQQQQQQQKKKESPAASLLPDRTTSTAATTTTTTTTSPVEGPVDVKTQSSSPPPLVNDVANTLSSTTLQLPVPQDEQGEKGGEGLVVPPLPPQPQAPEVELPIQTTATVATTTTKNKDPHSTMRTVPSVTTTTLDVPISSQEEKQEVGSPIVSSSSLDVPMVQSPPPLPEGWVSMIDPTTSKTYYYHAQDHLTTWEHPQPQAPPPPSSSSSSPPLPPVSSGGLSPTTNMTTAALSASVVVSPKSTREEEPPYVASLPTDKTKIQGQPPLPLQEEEEEEENVAEENSPAAIAIEKVKKEPSLSFPPEAKEEEKDTTPTQPPQQEKEQPQQPQLQDDVVVEDNNAITDIATTAMDDEITTPSHTNVLERELPEGWEELVDPSSGNTYYYNVVENTTTWERPSVVEVVEESAVSATENTKEKEEEQPPQMEDDDILGTAEGKEEEEEEEVVVEHATEDSVFPEPEHTMTPEEEIYVQEETRDTIAPEETSTMHGAGEQQQEEVPEENVTTTPVEEQQEEVPAPPTSTVETETVAPEVEMEDSTTEMVEGAPLAVEEEPSSEPTPQPESVNEEVEEDAPTQQQQQQQQQLPPGWVELVDPNSGNPYYFNEVENTTTWERPELLPLPPPPTTHEEEEIVEVAETEEQPLEELMEQHVEESNSPETEHEMEQQVDTDGVDATTTSTTTRAAAAPPTEDEEPPIVGMGDELPVLNDNTLEEKASGVEAVESTLEQPEISQDAESNTEEQSEVIPPVLSVEGEELSSLLPEGWVELVDPNSGNPYYFHEAENVTTWERPQREETPKEPIALPSLMDAALDDDGDDDGDEEEEDETSQPELVQEDEIDQGEVPQTLDPVLPTEAVVSAEDPVDEPESYTEREVEKEGQTVADAVEPELAEPMNNEESENVGIVEEEESSAVLPTGWVELVDPASGNPYYFNEAENITTWDPPLPTVVPGTNDIGEKALAPTETKAARVQESSSDLPEMKQDTLDSDEGLVEEESLPIDNDMRGESDMGALDESEIVQEESEQVTTEATNEAEIVEGNDSKVEDAGVPNLPSGWVQLVDPSSGNPYYLNEAENITSWDPPSFDDTPAEQAAMDEGITKDEKVASPPAAESEAIIPETEQESGIDADATLPTDEPEVAVQTDDPSVPEKLASNDDHQDSDLVLQKESEVVEIGKDVNSGVESASSLPPGWVELIDPASGNPYYLHEADGVTMWDKPQFEREEGERVKDETCTEPMEAEQGIEKAQSIEVPDQEKDREKDKVGEREELETDEMLDEEEDREKDKVGEKEELEIDEISKASETEEQDAEDDVAHSNDAVNPLPPGWSKLIDPSSGDPYYINEDENITSWDFPVVNEVETDEIVHEVDQPQDQPQVEDSNPEDDISEKPSLNTCDEAQPGTEDAIAEDETSGGEGNNPLPPGWVELIDPSSGNPYYLNEADDVTTWERPIPEDQQSKIAEKEHAKEENVAAVAEDIVPGDLVPEAHNDGDRPMSPQHRESVIMGWEEEPIDEVDDAMADTDEQVVVSDELPPGWVELIDSGSGNPYYLNEDENVTTWERPALPQIEENNVDDTSGGPSSESQDESPSNGVDEVVASNSAKSSDSVDMEKEVAQDEVSENNTDEMAIEPKSEADADHEMPLPMGWVELIDPSSGQPYYLHEGDGITTWERPSIVQENLEKEEPHSSENAKKMPVEAADELSSADENEVNEPAEESVVDKTKDDEKESEQAIKEENDNEDESQLPQGWVELIDPSSGNPYYLNEAEDITTWDKPAAVDSQSGETTEDKTEDVTIPPKDTAEGTSLKKDYKDTGSVLEKDNSKALPPGWVKLFDEDSGTPYYFNEVENRTTWDPPIGGSEDSYEVTDVPSQSEGRDVAIDSAGDAIPSHAVVVAERSKMNNNLTGPLNSYEEEVVMSYIERKIYEKETKGDLLWQLVRIAVLSKGRLRSDEGVMDASGPEAAIVDLLLEDDFSHNVDGSVNTEEHTGIDSSSLQSIQNLLLRGQREEAVEEALSSGNFAIALLVSSMCDRGTFKKATLRYADDVLLSGSPLHTLAMLFSGQLQPPDASDLDGSSPSSSLWNCSPQQLSNSWRFHLAAIISNRIVGWDRIAIALGDKLRDSGNVQAAHFCYMICGCPISSPEHSSTRIALVGCDHNISINTTLTTEESVDAFERTEAYEWAKQRGNPKAVIKSLQTFKIKYAAILADLGLVKEATAYQESLRRDVKGNENDLAALSELDGRLTPHRDHPETSSRQPFVSVAKPAPNSCESWEKVETHEASVPESPGRPGYVASMPVMSEGAQLASVSGPPPVSQEKLHVNEEEEFTDANAGTFDDDDDETFLSARTAMTGTSTSVVTEKPAEKAKKPMFFNAAQIKEEVQKDISPDMGNRVAPAVESSRVAPVRTATTSGSSGGIPPVMSTSSHNDKPVMSFAGKPPTFQSSVPLTQDGPPQTPASPSPTGAPPAAATPTAEGLPKVHTAIPLASSAPPMFQAAMPSPGGGGPSSGGAGMPPLAGKKSTTPLAAPAKADDKSFSTPSAFKMEPGQPQQAPQSAPVPKAEKVDAKDKTRKAPSSDTKQAPSSGGWGFGLTDWVTKKLNPDATKADLGDGMQAYYDEDKKVWVFPGEDPAEVAKPIAPPPTMGAAAPQPTPEDKPAAASNDPLAAMMAPPNLRGPSALKNRGSGGGRSYPGMASPGGGPPTMMMGGAGGSSGAAPPVMKMPSAPGGGKSTVAAPPQFMVFQPKPGANTGAQKLDSKPQTDKEPTEKGLQ